MSKIHIATLIDRFDDGAKLTITAQSNGRTLSIRVPERFRKEAASIWGGNQVCYEFRGGQAFFFPNGDE